MFLRNTKFNKNIKWRKYKNLFFFKNNKESLYFQAYNFVDIKHLKNFVYFKQNFFSIIFFKKNLNFKKKSKLNMWWFCKKYKNYNIQFVPNSHYLLKIQTIFNSNFKKILYKASRGNSILFWYSSKQKNKNVFKYPSKKKLILPFFLFCFFNRAEGFFQRKSIFRFYKFSKKITVRGIAQNPNDHHNGGSSKVKKPFLNKYFKIAKNNK